MRNEELCKVRRCSFLIPHQAKHHPKRSYTVPNTLIGASNSPVTLQNSVVTLQNSVVTL
jgi:hypothetical protein